MLRVFVAVLFGVQALFNSEAGHAQGSYRSRPVKVICGFPAGMSADIMARLYGQKLSEKFGQQFVVENRLGASGNLAAEAVARSDADGYTLLLGTVANSISASAFKNISHDFNRDFAPIAVVSSTPSILVVSEGLGVTSVAGLIKVAKERKDQLFFGSAGVGTAPHLSGELFNMMAGVKLTHVALSRQQSGPRRSSQRPVTGDLCACANTGRFRSGFARQGARRHVGPEIVAVSGAADHG